MGQDLIVRVGFSSTANNGSNEEISQTEYFFCELFATDWDCTRVQNSDRKMFAP